MGRKVRGETRTLIKMDGMKNQEKAFRLSGKNMADESATVSHEHADDAGGGGSGLVPVETIFTAMHLL